MTKKTINQPVHVSAVTFDRQFEPVPRRIEFEGRTLTFISQGIRLLIKSNGHMTRLWDMCDGEAYYRLRRDDGAWTLVTISR
ncbi:MAG: hypothetical protein WBB39_02950 [Candidatus Saccharimonadales bacterium]|nr:hypothetical protein [Candidatus Saccharibacteria bacterium]